MTTDQLWAALKRKLIAELGRDGYAAWVAFAAKQAAIEARREPIELKAERSA
jgi:hypothetical protein